MTIVRDVAGIVLAAGRSSRMGEGRNKLLEDVAGRPIVARVVDAFLEAEIDPLIVVTGHQADRVRSVLEDRRVRFVDHAGWREGMGSSISEGMAELRRSGALCAAVLVCVGDLPGLRADHVRAIVRAAREPSGGIDPARIVVPSHRGQRGHPVLFGARHFAALGNLTGDEGARSVVRGNAPNVHLLEFEDDACLRDVDTVDDLAALRTRISG
ncbi:MAG: nucleotidyltransferase family protein [Deltaproteobacteria bacterium]|nr:nucleotidyltransferase family protein [Deltaproteobacteria bacterium]